MNDTYVAICLFIGCLLTGLIVWLYIKARVGAKLSQAVTNLANEELLHAETKSKLKDLETQHSKILQEYNHAITDKAVAVANKENVELVVNSLKRETEEYKRQIDRLQSDIKLSIQQQTKAATELREASKNIEALQRTEKELRFDNDKLQEQFSEIKEQNSVLRSKYEETEIRLEEQQQFIADANAKLKDAFSSLSAEALNKNNESFVVLAKATLENQVTEAKGEFEKKEQAISELVKPLGESLGRFDAKMQELENTRLQQHGQVNQFIAGLQQSAEKLQKETGNLVTALKSSRVRGRYGEIALKRLVEFAGLNDFCDFEEQVHVNTDDGRLKPDMIIRLPGNKRLVVDAKTPLDSYLAAFETTDEQERTRLLNLNAIAVRQHLKKLSEKAYWSQFSDSPDYVIMYMQIESSFGAALEIDRTLIEDGINNRVILATPTTLITLLRTVAFSWQQTKIAADIEEIRVAGVELFNRTNTLLYHFNSIGSSLRSAATHYNNAVGSLESRFLPQARRMKELSGTYIKEDLKEIDQIEVAIRPMNQLPTEGEV
jgi:DNA recombination protein RmuC